MSQLSRTCGKCKIAYPLSAEHWYYTNKPNRAWRCKGCYLTAIRLRQQAIRDRVRELKSAPCMDCGGTFPPVCMDFDHLGDDKIMDISKMVTNSGWGRIQAEIEKCDLVCSNCHRIRTELRRNCKEIA